MTFPTVIATAGGNYDSNATVVTINLPNGSNVSGRRILLFLTSDGAGETFSYPTGFTELIPEGGDGFTQGAAFRNTDGTEGWGATGATTVATISSVEQSCHTTYLLSGFGTDVPAISAAGTGSGTASNPPALNPAGWATEDTLWFAYTSLNGVNATTPRISAYPSSYTGTTNISAGGNGVVQGVAYRANATASEDPGVFTHDSTVWQAYTVGIRPSSVVSASGTLTGTLGALTLTSACATSRAGTLTGTLGALTLTSASTMTAKATLTGTLGALTISAAATNAATAAGTLTGTLEALTLTSANKLYISGTQSGTLGAVALTSANKLIIDADLASTLGDAALTSANKLYIDGDLAGTLDATTLTSANKLYISGTQAGTLGALTLSSEAFIGTVPVLGTLNSALGALTLNGEAKAFISASVTNAALANVTLESTSKTSRAASLDATLGAVTLTSNAVLPVAGNMAGTLGSIVLASTTALTVYGSLTGTLSGAALASTSTMSQSGISGQTDATLAMLVMLATGAIVLPPGLRKTYKHPGHNYKHPGHNYNSHGGDYHAGPNRNHKAGR